MTDAPQLGAKTHWETTFFATMWPEYQQWKDEIVRYLYELSEEQPHNIASGIAPGTKSATGLYESAFDLLERDHPGLQALRSFVVRAIQDVVLQVSGNEVPRSALDVRISDSWCHITNNGGFHDAHYHGNCSWCGIVYLQLGDTGGRVGESGAPNGGNRFYSPLWNGGRYIDYGNRELSRAHFDPPVCDGMLLVFPSFLQHSALPYRGRLDRVVVSFNSSTTLREVP